MDESERLLTPGEVATIFRVDPKTVSRWAADGKITRIRTPGGHNRFTESGIRERLRQDGVDSPQALIDRVLATTRHPAAR